MRFNNFGIDADMSKVSVTDAYVTINELSKEIKKSEIATYKKKERKKERLLPSKNRIAWLASIRPER
jgi:hypothetical protein